MHFRSLDISLIGEFFFFFINEGNLKKKDFFLLSKTRKQNSMNSMVHFIQNYILNENKFSSPNVERDIGSSVTSNESL